MTTYRALAEAGAFHRRRTTMAFLTGSPDGRRIEAPRPGRCIVGGLLLAAVCATGAAASATLTGHPTVSWDHGQAHVSP
jgi:hypothetical protein